MAGLCSGAGCRMIFVGAVFSGSAARAVVANVMANKANGARTYFMIRRFSKKSESKLCTTHHRDAAAQRSFRRSVCGTRVAEQAAHESAIAQTGIGALDVV